MSIQVIVYSVSTDVCDVTHDIREYDNWEEVLSELEEDYPDGNVYGDSVRDLDNDNEIVFEFDVGFVKYQIIEEE